MDARELNDAIGSVDEKYVAEAEGYRAAAKRGVPRWLPIAACLLVAAGVGVFALRGWDGKTIGASDVGSTNDVDAGASSSSTTSDAATDEDVIVVNEGDPVTSDSAADWAAEYVYTEDWTCEDFYADFGFEPVCYVPEGLVGAPGQDTGTVTVVRANDDDRLLDGTLTLQFYTGFYEDGSPLLTEGVAAPKGYTLEATKLGAEGDAVGYLIEDGSEVSTIAGCDVRIWHMDAEYGPYDETTHEASGTYDWYYAEFVYRDVRFRIQFSQLDLETVVQVVRSVTTS